MNFGKEFRDYAVKHRGISGLATDQYIHHIGGQTSHQVDDMTRTVIEERPVNFREIDVFSRLMADRIVFFGTQVDDYIANIVVAQFLFLESMDAKRDIQMYVNSPGGSVYAGLGIYDTMQYIQPDVATICTGMAASMGAVLLCAGAKNKRSALPHSRIMIHQPMSGTQGQVADMEIALKETVKVRDELYQIMAYHTGKDYETIYRDCDRDNWMNSQEAKDYGLIDEVLTRGKK